MTTILNNGHAQGNFAADMPAVKIQFFKVEKRCTYVQTSKHIPIFKQYWNGGGGIKNVYYIMKFDTQGFFKYR